MSQITMERARTGMRLLGPAVPGREVVLTPEAPSLRGRSWAHVRAGYRALLAAAARACKQRLDAGERFDFLAGTRDVREGDWTVAPLPEDLLDRRVEITGPVDRKMIINALNSGASVFMADFEDATAPTWQNLHRGAAEPAATRCGATIQFTNRRAGKSYALGETDRRRCMVRPRGWHLAGEARRASTARRCRRRSSTSASTSSTTRRS